MFVPNFSQAMMIALTSRAAPICAGVFKSVIVNCRWRYVVKICGSPRHSARVRNERWQAVKLLWHWNIWARDVTIRQLLSGSVVCLFNFINSILCCLHGSIAVCSGGYRFDLVRKWAQLYWLIFVVVLEKTNLIAIFFDFGMSESRKLQGIYAPNKIFLRSHYLHAS